MAEAAGEGYKGMYAVACVIRNRGGDLHGFCGAKREDISLFCNRQGREVVREAQQIEHVVFERKGPDITKGATHFEAVEKYGVPYWIKDVQVTVKIGSHTFFKRRQDGRRSK
jgi:spore germination cell wall hydrolase CwlJ-like protein